MRPIQGGPSLGWVSTVSCLNCYFHRKINLPLIVLSAVRCSRSTSPKLLMSDSSKLFKATTDRIICSVSISSNRLGSFGLL
ncbi:hypothetical protein DL93DRAFT_829779 [Clavulina sp. PMI_390]|nr:hypothetical protein DL93DRAFT_829779 [Clavulina sp. PMI_390]